MKTYNIYKRTIVILAACTVLALAYAADISHAAPDQASHMKKLLNSEGCAACHSGRGVSGGGLLKARREKLCYKCHGVNSVNRGRARADIESVMFKFSKHPIEETSHLHRPGERLPAESQSDPRHVACGDCHVSHVSSPGKEWYGIPGYRPGLERGAGKGLYSGGRRIKLADMEYEICYRCHSDGVNMPMESADVSVGFDPRNMSYHPIENSGKNMYVPSLVIGFDERSIIKCTSCHGNGDPTGPTGPHGSDFPPILLAEYEQEDGPESISSYALCYICHSRESVLGDESFKSHKYHVSLHNISCAACHSAHGSSEYTNLIKFRDDGSIMNASDGMGPMYVSASPGRPKCFLSCHGGDHNTSSINGVPWPW